MPGKLSQIVICSFLLMFFVSCSPGNEPTQNIVPDEIIQPDSMVTILTEVHIAEAILRELKTDAKQKDAKAKASFAKIFKKHEVTREQYEMSIEYYQQHLDIYQDIYERVITLLSQKQSENTSDEKEE